MPLHDELLDLSLRIAREAGALAKRRRHEGVEIAASKSAPEDIVTLADREVEALIRSMILDARPSDGFYGEESAAQSGTSGLTWVVDPIDGTVNYAYGIPFYAVSIAVAEGADPGSWETIVGTVVNPAIGEEFTAVAGGGAFLNGSAIRVADRVPLPLALVGTGFSYQAERRVRQAELVRGLVAEVRDIRRIGTASLDLCGVAVGRLNAYFERGLNPWDHAAGALVAREAGATVGALHGDRESSDLLIAAEPGLFGDLAGLLESLGVGQLPR